MLAVLTEERFSDPGWIFEPKLDGIRCLAFVRGGEVRLLSRNRLLLNAAYPEIVERLAGATTDDAILDGEIVALEHGVSSFQRLQQRSGLSDAAEIRRSRVRVHFYVFDILYHAGHDLRRLPLLSRKRELRSVLRTGGAVRRTRYRRATGEAYFAEACRRGLEGVIAKRSAAPYAEGRSRDWLKFKCVNEQEFVIGGYTEPQGSRGGFGALLVGYHDKGTLRYAGKVGTGYDAALLESLGARLARMERIGSPFHDPPRIAGRVHWVRPVLVAQVGFQEWTTAGLLRHPRFLGLRQDKAAADVVRERAAT